MADVGPLTFDDLHVPGTPPVGLPNLIPQVDSTAISALDAALGWPGYALGLRRILSPETRKIYARWQGADARTMLGLSADQQAILVGHADDDMVETLWTRRRADHLAETIADQGWDLVIGPDFSVYGNQPRAEHLIAMRRSLLVAAELAAAGAPVAPTLHWFRHEDLQRYLDWIVDRHPAGPAAVACNLQTLRTDRAWNELALPGLALIAATLPPDLPVMLCGTSRASRIAELVTLFGTRTHVITQSPLHYARHGAVMTATGRQHTDWQVPELFAANVLYYHNLLEAHR
ncbi:DUF4417 domain-containing protein (plasmid) [Nonomuraea sp. NBC_00507]|uniref:DUF4417 domain-containing protein n=1 Tax=Nonomuraea sp. NBC_00507 TaxID=2976002 RepID=UPI002E175805